MADCEKKTKPKKPPLEVFGGLILGIILGVYKAWAIVLMWGWFVTPVFGTPAPRLVLAYGLLILVRFVTQAEDPLLVKAKEAFPDNYYPNYVGMSVVYVTLMLAIAWVVHLFV